MDHLLESSLRELREKMDGKLALAPLPKGPSSKLKAATKLQVWSFQPQAAGEALVMIDFITKPWRKRPMPWPDAIHYR